MNPMGPARIDRKLSVAPIMDWMDLNVGCPSDRVQRGRFGACLMLESELVAECMAAMIDAVDISVTIKTRVPPGFSTR